MFPENTPKIFLAISLAPGPIAEQPISNESFLNSFLDYGCWLRVVSAYGHLQTLDRKESSKIERLAAMASFYQLAGQGVEDALTNLIAWTLWAPTKEASLCDIFQRLSLRLSVPDKPMPKGYVSLIKQQMQSSKKRLEVYPREFLAELISHPDAEVPREVGIEWKTPPSVKLVPPDLRTHWDQLPVWMKESMRPLTSTKGALLASCYNKAKHGPQLVITTPREAAILRGCGLDEVGDMGNEASIRLLMQGQRVQETVEEADQSVRIAPFLIDDVNNLRRWYFQHLVQTANFLFLTGTWIFNCTFKDRKREFGAPNDFLKKVIGEQTAHYQRTFSPSELKRPLRKVEKQ